METTHTKGPWKQRFPGSVAVVDALGNPVAFTDTRLPLDECVANAGLIAAAPDLLAACRQAVEICEDGDTGANFSKTVAAMQACADAIAKALGR